VSLIIAAACARVTRRAWRHLSNGKTPRSRAAHRWRRWRCAAATSNSASVALAARHRRHGIKRWRARGAPWRVKRS